MYIFCHLKNVTLHVRYARLLVLAIILNTVNIHLVSAHEGDNDAHPVEFIKNKGQWNGPFAYRAAIGNIEVFLEKDAFTYLVGAADNAAKRQDAKFGKIKKPVYSYHAYRMRMLNTNENTTLIGNKPQQHYYNYFYGNDTSKWQHNIHPNLAVDYESIYNGINLHVASEGASIKYDFIVQPGAAADQIKLQFEGADKLELKKGLLVIGTGVGEVYEMAPYAYQYINGKRKEVSCNYKLKDSIVTYNFPKGYDETQPLIIDPNVVFSTFTGSTADNWGFTATYDAVGNFYAGGIAGSSGYPLTTGLRSYVGGDGADGNGGAIKSDMSITKFNATGTAIIYSTYLGGSSQDQPHSMITNAQGELYIAGRTFSSDFPIPPANTSTINGKCDIIVIKLSAAGILANARFVGGSEDDGINISSVFDTVRSLKHSFADDARSEILLDNAGNVYVAGSTKSTNFPIANATKSTLSGAQDGVVFKMDGTLSTFIWSTYICGSNVDAAYVLALNRAQNSVYVAGGTASNDFTGIGGIWNTYQGGTADGFIQKYQNNGSYALQSATLVGRGDYDQVFGIQLDALDNVYVLGQTLGGTFPVSAGVFSNPNSSQFLMKLNTNLSTTIYSTVFGSGTRTSTNITPVAFMVDTCENVYISGWGREGSATGMTTQNVNTTTPNNILSATAPDGDDLYFGVFSRNATALLFGAYFGGPNTGEHVDGGTSRFDKNGVVYQALCGGCGARSNVPTTTNAYSRTNRSNNCNILALKIEFNLGSVKASAQANPNTSVCLGEPVNFTSVGSSNVITYDWSFGDGNTSNLPSPSHTYTSGGTFQVRLVTINPNACVTHDTARLTIRVDTNSINADFEITPSDNCKPYVGTITNRSRAGSGSTYLWDFGDGKTSTAANPGRHEYPDTGTYRVILKITNPAACNPEDTMSKIITFNTLFVDAQIGGPPVLCEKTKAVFSNNSTNATSYRWTFGDGGTSTSATPEHVYDTAGTYKVKMVAYNPLTCNRVDSQELTVKVESIPLADFRHQPLIPVTNEPVIFSNRSQRATIYRWDFGDNTQSELETPDPKYYRRTGTYRVCLQAQNTVGCSDTVCRNVDADVYPLADLPKAFSPNGDGVNDILYVRGAGIETVDLKIYNRWGQLVFESTNVDMGWDGRFNGKEQPMEAYGFTLSATFVDGNTFSKKGNVTLLR